MARSTTLFWVIALGIGAFRLYYCAQLPVNTGDIVRHLVYGFLVNQDGLGMAGKTLVEVNPLYASVSWSNLPYNYPSIPLFFFAAISAISPTIFSAKLALTVLEAISSLLIYRYSKDRWLALLYWIAPMSIWWVSHEGQFEALQNVFVFAALVALSRHTAVSFALLAMAIQVKLTAVLLLPLFGLFLLRKTSPQTMRTLLFASIALLGGFLPTILCLAFFPAISQVLHFSSPLQYNPYYWNPFHETIFLWNPGSLIAWNQIASYGLLLFLVLVAMKRRLWKEFLAPVLFLIVCKGHTNVQYWYMQLLPSFCLPIQQRRLRLALFAVVPFLDVRSAIQLFFQPFGWMMTDYYANFSVFAHIGQVVP